MTQSSLQRGNGYAVARNLNPALVATASLRPLGRETRKHSPAQIRKLQASIEQFGFVFPIIIDASNRVIGGWGLTQAALKLGLAEIPAVRITDLNEGTLRLLRLALNRLGEDSRWDAQALTLEFNEILELDSSFDLQISGFEMGEIDFSLAGLDADEEDAVPAPGETEAKTNAGDLWTLGDHRLFCGDALLPESFQRLLGDEKAQMVFTDPPYNVRIEGNVSGLGLHRHGEFAMASGEMSSAEFMEFLKKALTVAIRCSGDGALHFIFMDWRHVFELSAVGKELYGELKSLCVWNKSNGGMGSLYRSKHELVFAYKVGKAAHINNVELGRHGRNRTNVWDYAGQNALQGSNKSKLSLHPTVKPVALVADAIRDCSERGGIILDPFGGAGTTLVACEKTGRRARLIEIDPHYVDITVQRWERLTGKTAVRAPAALLPDVEPAAVPFLPPERAGMQSSAGGAS